MKILLSGGSSDLARRLIPRLHDRGHEISRLDIRPPQDQVGGTFIHGSILDRHALARSFTGVDTVVHIAAWHGIHEVRGEKDVYDFWELNVTGTFEVFETAVRTNIPNILYISSTSIRDRDGIYGHTKVLGEEIARTYHARHGVNVLTLRPRAFIPPWNRDTYANFIEWADWFWRGAVHIDDVAQAADLAIELLHTTRLDAHRALVVDGKYEYTADDLANWDAQGPGSTFRRHYPDAEALARSCGLDPAQKPQVLEMSETIRWLGYAPQYSLRTLLDELRVYGAAGPPAP